VAALVVARGHAEVVAVAFAEMGRGNEAAAYRDLHHRHLGLAEKLARPLEPKPQIIAGGRAVHELAEQPLDIAAGLAELGREGQQVQGFLNVFLHQLDGGGQFLAVDARIGLDRHVLAHRALADLVALLTISSTFKPFFKVLFTFPLLYFFTIGFQTIIQF